MATSSSECKLKLQASDGEIVEVDGSIFKRSMLADFIENQSNDPVPLPNINSAILKRVIEWATHHKDDPEPPEDDDDREKSTYGLSVWDKQFLNVEQDVLFELILAANYLDFQPLLEVTCKHVANLVKGKSPEDIRRTFNIRNSFTPEEEEKIRKENECHEET